MEQSGSPKLSSTSSRTWRGVLKGAAGTGTTSVTDDLRDHAKRLFIYKKQKKQVVVLLVLEEKMRLNSAKNQLAQKNSGTWVPVAYESFDSMGKALVSEGFALVESIDKGKQGQRKPAVADSSVVEGTPDSVLELRAPAARSSALTSPRRVSQKAKRPLSLEDKGTEKQGPHCLVPECPVPEVCLSRACVCHVGRSVSTATARYDCASYDYTGRLGATRAVRVAVLRLADPNGFQRVVSARPVCARDV